MAVLISINKPHTNNIFCGDKSVEVAEDGYCSEGERRSEE